MKKAIKICNQCRKPKRLDCDRCKPSTHNYNTIDQSNYKLYSSYKWRKFAHALRDERILCEMCLPEGRTTVCEMVDHIIEINRGGEIWAKDNLMVLCNKCHAKKSGKSGGKNKN